MGGSNRVADVPISQRSVVELTSAEASALWSGA